MLPSVRLSQSLTHLRRGAHTMGATHHSASLNTTHRVVLGRRELTRRHHSRCVGAARRRRHRPRLAGTVRTRAGRATRVPHCSGWRNSASTRARACTAARAGSPPRILSSRRSRRYRSSCKRNTRGRESLTRAWCYCNRMPCRDILELNNAEVWGDTTQKSTQKVVAFHMLNLDIM